jgi:hypothetical protein
MASGFRVNAGARSVSRGRAYQSQGRVDDLTVSEDGWLLASVTGGDRYAVTVWCDPERKTGGFLYSRCTCPAGGGCKHAVAVVAEYLELRGKDAEIPAADPDDERWTMLSGEGGEADGSEDGADDLDTGSAEGRDYEAKDQPRHRRSSGAGSRARQVADDKIRRYIDAKSREELAAMVCSLIDRFPELCEEFRDRIAQGGDTVGWLVTQAGMELKRVASESGWRNNWTGEGHTPDYSRLKHRLQRLLEFGHPDAVVRLASEIMTLGMKQNGQSNNEGEAAGALGECMPVIFPVVGFAQSPQGDTARDLKHFVDLLGFSPSEALQRGTRIGSQVMGMGSELGQVKEGCNPDLLLVDGDPLEDLDLVVREKNLHVVKKEELLYKDVSATATIKHVVNACGEC